MDTFEDETTVEIFFKKYPVDYFMTSDDNNIVKFTLSCVITCKRYLFILVDPSLSELKRHLFYKAV